MMGLQTTPYNIQSNMPSNLNAPTTMQSSLNFPTIINNLNQKFQTYASSVRPTKIEDSLHNVVVHRMPSNGTDSDYRNKAYRRNGIQEQFRRDADMSPPLNNYENFLNRRVSDYDEEDHSVPQPDSGHLELSEARLIDDKRIVKPAPLPGRYISLVDDTKDTLRKLYVIPQNTIDKKIVLIKNEPTDIQVYPTLPYRTHNNVDIILNVSNMLLDRTQAAVAAAEQQRPGHGASQHGQRGHCELINQSNYILAS